LVSDLRAASVTLAWHAPSANGILKYRLYYADMTGAKAAKMTPVDVGLATQASVSSLVAGHIYYFVVTDLNSAGEESQASNLVEYVAGPSSTPTPINQRPKAYAGPDQTIIVNTGGAKLRGTASDDGLPNPPGKLSRRWSKVSGPGKVKFTAPNSLSTTATFGGVPGIYVLKLSVTDGQLWASDTVTITVKRLR
jgi:Fibronectin type III domain